MVNLHQLILQHFQMLFHELMEYIFHEPKHKMIHEKVDLSKGSSPPESIFIRLTPSRQRYSFRDEL